MEVSQTIMKMGEGIDHAKLCEALKDTVPGFFKTTKQERRSLIWSEATEKLFQDRETARKTQSWDDASTINKAFRKSLREDNSKFMLTSFQADLDLRSKWMGLKWLRKGYAPAPYHRKNQGGEHIPMHARAEEAANYLSTIQCRKERHRSHHSQRTRSSHNQ